MGGKNTKFDIEYKTWPKYETHESRTNIYERDASIPSYQKNEKLSFGHAAHEIIQRRFNNEFSITDKGNSLHDGVRKTYSDNPDCCLIEDVYIISNNVIATCDPFTKNLNSTYCDNILYNECVVKKGNNVKCKPWVRSVVQYAKPIFLNVLPALAEEKERNNPLTIEMINALRDFATDTNTFNDIADKIILNYSNDILINEYKCIFPPTNIRRIENTRINVPRECWYRECALAPSHKLLKENLKMRRVCRITSCNIDIAKLEITDNDIAISCQNVYSEQRFDIQNNNALRIDQPDLFYIPSLQTTFIPLFLLLLLVYIR